MVPDYEQFIEFIDGFPFDRLLNEKKDVIIYKQGNLSLVGKGEDPSEITYSQLQIPVRRTIPDSERAYAIPLISRVLSDEAKLARNLEEFVVGWDPGASHARWLILLPMSSFEPAPRTHLLHELVEVFFRERGYEKPTCHKYAVAYEKRYAEERKTPPNSS